MQGIDIKTVSLDVIGFCMKAEAGRVKGDIIPVTRALWLEIANRLQKEKSVDLERIIDQLKAESLILDNDAGHRAVEIIEAGGVGNV